MPPKSDRKKSSLDYPLLARTILEASLEASPSKLPQGLYVVATPIGNLGDMSLRALTTLALADRIACEDTRASGLMLSKYGIKKPLLSYHDHNADERRPEIMKALADGAAIALISDAGMPLIADPGYKLVRDCRENGYPVTVIPGPNAALMALAGSGLPTDKFYFVGFLPPKKIARQKMLDGLKSSNATLIFYEAPQRVADTLKDLADCLGSERPAAIARELTKLFEETRTGNLGELATHYKTHTPKGEITIVVGAALEVADTSLFDLDDILKEHLRTKSLRDAVTSVCSITGAKKNEVYARALWLAGKSSG